MRIFIGLLFIYFKNYISSIWIKLSANVCPGSVQILCVWGGAVFLFCFNDKLFQIYFPLFLIESTSFKFEQQVNSKYLFLIIFSSEIMITRGHLLVNCSDDMLLHSKQQMHSFHFHYNFIITMQLGFLERILMSIL